MVGLAIVAAKSFSFGKRGNEETATPSNSVPEPSNPESPKPDPTPLDKVTESGTPNRGVSSIAISLRELKGLPNTKDAQRLFGATRLLGFLFTEDERGKDCILICSRQDGRPSLNLDDLAIAYRNVSAGEDRPACSIDLGPDALKQLNKLSREFQAVRDPAEVEPLVKQWEKLAGSVREVQVMHVEGDNNFAKTMVNADSRLKSIVDGTASVKGILGFPELQINQAKDEIARTGKLEMRLALSNRFMFSPGKVAYRTDGKLFLLASCEVVLLAEEETLREGRQTGTGKGYPLAKKFADDFTNKFDEIADAEPVFRDLENLYRAVAIMCLMKAEAKTAGAENLLEATLGKIEIGKEQVTRSLPGRGTVRKVESKAPSGAYFVLWLPTCGGVSVDINVKNIKREPALIFPGDELRTYLTGKAYGIDMDTVYALKGMTPKQLDEVRQYALDQGLDWDKVSLQRKLPVARQYIIKTHKEEIDKRMKATHETADKAGQFIIEHLARGFLEKLGGRVFDELFPPRRR